MRDAEAVCARIRRLCAVTDAGSLEDVREE